MKKILGISLVAVFAVAPLMARAETGLASEPTHAATASSGNTTTVVPQYEVAPADSATDGNLATAGYVKGAYNAAIRGINKVAADAVQTANLADKSLDIDAKTLKVNGEAVLTGADISNKADKGTALASYGITDAYTKTEVNSAIEALSTVYDAAGTAATAAAAALNSAQTYAADGSHLNANSVAAESLATAIRTSLGKADTALQNDSALNGANLTTESVAKTALDTTVQASLAKADSALQTGSALNGANLTAGTVAKTALDTTVQASLDKADTALQANSALNGANLNTASVAETALATDVQTALASARTALQTAAIANMATKNGVLATINSATVPVMAVWGSTAVDTTSLKVQAPAAYVPGQGE